jgi:hypothetical protein
MKPLVIYSYILQHFSILLAEEIFWCWFCHESCLENCKTFKVYPHPVFSVVYLVFLVCPPPKNFEILDCRRCILSIFCHWILLKILVLWKVFFFVKYTTKTPTSILFENPESVKEKPKFYEAHTYRHSMEYNMVSANFLHAMLFLLQSARTERRRRKW